MQNISRGRKILLVALVVVFIAIIIALIVAAVNNSSTKNQYGSFIKIQNYDQKVKHLTPTMKDAMQSSLYKLVKKNSVEGFEASTVKDAYIRDSSDTQNYDSYKNLYYGTFIVDMASIKQSYGVQYSYSTTNTLDLGGSPIIFSCLPKDKLRYGEFDCKDFVGDQSNPNDIILQYLPRQTFSYKISPDATAEDGSLTLVVTLTIPESDLKGDVNSRMQVVAMYKKQVTDWISSKGLDPTKYKMTYNYTDTGALQVN